ncbi:MAG: RluA family pseudouridine synthase [Treponema sp.]|nr:RluA family pseudouridine synthase [Treponema sp.]
MDFTEFYASSDDNDRRLDRILRKFISQEALSGIYSAVRKGLIKVNGKKAEPGKHIFAGDCIRIANFLLESENSRETEYCTCSENKKKTSLLETERVPLNTEELPEIILKTEDILILNKPYDITVQGQENSLNKSVEVFFRKEQKNKSLSFTPGPMHRLDRKTTGAIAFSMSLKGARWFSEAIKTHEIKKDYIGILQEKLLQPEYWKDNIKREYNAEKAFQTVLAGDTGKEAITKVTPLGYGKYKKTDYTLARFSIETGRTHQIRSQAALHGHPLLGDTAYGGTKIEMTEYFLHAYELYFPKDNPLSLPEKIKAPVPKVFENFLKTTMQDYEKCGII